MTKITSLSSSTEFASDDLLVIVDVSDTTMASSGTNKQITIANALNKQVYTTETSDYTMSTTDNNIFVDASSNTVTVTTPDATDCDGQMFTIIAVDVSNTITLDGYSSQTINGSSTFVFSTIYESIPIFSYNGNWIIK